jgi:hypothetical protein
MAALAGRLTADGVASPFGDASVVTIVATWSISFAAGRTTLGANRDKLRLWQRRSHRGCHMWRRKADGDAAATGAVAKISFPSAWRRNPSVLWAPGTVRTGGTARVVCR